jgi:hypothetical protein
LVVLPRTVTWLTTDARCKATSGRPENEEDRRHDDERDDDRTGVGESSGVVRRRAVVPRGGADGEVRQDVGGPAASTTSMGIAIASPGFAVSPCQV